MKYDLSHDIANADLAWHDLETRLKTGEDIVDINVLPAQESSRHFEDRDEVREAYEGFLADPRLKRAPSRKFIQGRLLGQLLQLDLLEGGTIDVFKQVETAMGSELALVKEEDLDAKQQQIEDELQKHGLGFDPSFAGAFEDRLGIERSKAALRRFNIAFARRTGMLAIGEKPGDSIVIPEIVEVDEPWVGYFGTDKQTGLPYTKMNAHGRHGYTRPRAAAIVAHEGRGHAQDYEYKHGAIRQNDMDPLFGITTIFTCENVSAETIALGREQQTLLGVQGQNAWEYRVQAMYHDYLESVWNNVLVYINTGKDEDEVVDYLRGRLLSYEKEENMRGRTRTIRDNPAWRANTAAYEPGMRVVREALKLPTAQQDKFFRELSKYPYSERQMLAMLGQETAVSLAA